MEMLEQYAELAGRTKTDIIREYIRSLAIRRPKIHLIASVRVGERLIFDSAKSDLPTKMCPVCQRPFTWRKKWQDCWDEVKYCSERCRRRRSEAKD